MQGKDAAADTYLFPNAADQAVFLTIIIQRRNHARRQHVVDELQEALICHMSICEQEHDLQDFNPMSGAYCYLSQVQFIY